MSSGWHIYRTRFLVRAQQLKEPLTFKDALGREHHGVPGDYLVQSSEGLRVAPREIFEDVYAPMESVGGESQNWETERAQSQNLRI
jgi:hypothetical protein